MFLLRYPLRWRLRHSDFAYKWIPPVSLLVVCSISIDSISPSSFRWLTVSLGQVGSVYSDKEWNEVEDAFGQAQGVYKATTPRGSHHNSAKKVNCLEGYDNTIDQSILNILHGKWTGDYLPESLNALRDVMRCNGKRIAEGLKIYAKTLLLVQSTGMGKSRLADKLGETCPMINFTFGKENFKCYPPVDEEVRSFLCENMPEEAKTAVLAIPGANNLSSKRFLEQSESKVSTLKLPKPEKMTIEPPSLNRVSFLVEENKRSRASERRVKEYHENLATTLWNHTRAVAFLQASFEVCKLCQLFIL